jgi:hypothetical protein
LDDVPIIQNGSQDSFAEITVGRSPDPASEEDGWLYLGCPFAQNVVFHQIKGWVSPKGEVELFVEKGCLISKGEASAASDVGPKSHQGKCNSIERVSQGDDSLGDTLVVPEPKMEGSPMVAPLFCFQDLLKPMMGELGVRMQEKEGWALGFLGQLLEPFSPGLFAKP